jgi:hypothetical protein
MMLREIANVRQVEGEPRRRWFTDDQFDLVLWGDGSDIVGFQLCYDKQEGERALTWKESAGFSHSAVDGGEDRPGRYKATPILTGDGGFDAARVAEGFLGHCGVLDSRSADFIYLKLLEYPER